MTSAGEAKVIALLEQILLEVKNRSKTGPGLAQDVLKEAAGATMLKSYQNFIQAYPEARRDADPAISLVAWEALKPDATTRAAIMASLEVWKESWDWQKDEGKWIPNPARFITGRQWEQKPGEMRWKKAPPVKCPCGADNPREVSFRGGVKVCKSCFEDECRQIAEDEKLGLP